MFKKFEKFWKSDTGAIRPLALVVTTLVVTTLIGAGTAAAASNSDNGLKVFVCKYVGTPGEDEVLQTGNNPIEVSVNAIKDWDQDGYPPNGYEFQDAQGRSIVIAESPTRGDGQRDEPTIEDCPLPDGPPPVEPVLNLDLTACGVPDEFVPVGAKLDASEELSSLYVIVEITMSGETFELTKGRADEVAPGLLNPQPQTVGDTFTVQAYADEDFTQPIGDPVSATVEACDTPVEVVVPTTPEVPECEVLPTLPADTPYLDYGIVGVLNNDGSTSYELTATLIGDRLFATNLPDGWDNVGEVAYYEFTVAACDDEPEPEPKPTPTEKPTPEPKPETPKHRPVPSTN